MVQNQRIQGIKCRQGHKADKNAVIRHDFSDIDETEEEGTAKARQQGEEKNAMTSESSESLKREAATTSAFTSLLQSSTTMATVAATLITLMVF